MGFRSADRRKYIEYIDRPDHSNMPDLPSGKWRHVHAVFVPERVTEGTIQRHGASMHHYFEKIHESP